jgi:hypothetical protein
MAGDASGSVPKAVYHALGFFTQVRQLPQSLRIRCNMIENCSSNRVGLFK